LTALGGASSLPVAGDGGVDSDGWEVTLLRRHEMAELEHQRHQQGFMDTLVADVKRATAATGLT